MRMFESVSIFAILMASMTALCYTAYLGPGSSSLQKKPGVATVIESRSSILQQYPSLNNLWQKDGLGPKHSLDSAIRRTLRDPNSISAEKPVAMTANERKMLMYAIKTIDEPLNNAQ
jgi:hypothetical protein